MRSITVMLLLSCILNLIYVVDFVNGKNVQPKSSPFNNMDIPDGLLKLCLKGLTRTPVWIDLRYFRCDDGYIVSIAPPSIPPSTTTSLGPVSTSLPTTSENNGICRFNDMLYCDGTPQCGAKQGYKCCGFKRYHPDFQTCCKISSAKYKIHNDKSEREHVCCHLKVYKRGSKSLPCEHPSSNEKFSSTLTSLKSLKKERTRCDMDTQNALFLFKIDIKSQSPKGTKTNPSLSATVSMWPLISDSTTRARMNLNDPTQSATMEIPFDKFSRMKKNLVGRSYFTISTKNYLDNAIFYLNSPDSLYKWPKRSKKLKRVSKMLNKIKRRCNRQNSRSRKRSRSSQKTNI